MTAGPRGLSVPVSVSVARILLSHRAIALLRRALAAAPLVLIMCVCAHSLSSSLKNHVPDARFMKIYVGLWL